MHISPTIHCNAGHNYKVHTHYNTGADVNLLHGNRFSPWEDFFVNPFSSDVISPNHNESTKVQTLGVFLGIDRSMSWKQRCYVSVSYVSM